MAKAPLVIEQRVAAAVHPLPGRVEGVLDPVDASRRMPTRSIRRYDAVLAAKQLAVTRRSPRSWKQIRRAASTASIA